VQAAWNGEAPLTIPYKYMFSRLRDKYEVLEEQIDDKAQLLAEIMKIDEWSPHNQLLSVILNLHICHSDRLSADFGSISYHSNDELNSESYGFTT